MHSYVQPCSRQLDEWTNRWSDKQGAWAQWRWWLTWRNGLVLDSQVANFGVEKPNGWCLLKKSWSLLELAGINHNLRLPCTSRVNLSALIIYYVLSLPTVNLPRTVDNCVPYDTKQKRPIRSTYIGLQQNCCALREPLIRSPLWDQIARLAIEHWDRKCRHNQCPSHSLTINSLEKKIRGCSRPKRRTSCFPESPACPSLCPLPVRHL